MENPLARWFADHGGTPAKRLLVQRIRDKTGRKYRWQTLHLIARGDSVPQPVTARDIELGTDGEASAAALFAWFVENPPKRRSATPATAEHRSTRRKGRDARAAQ